MNLESIATEAFQILRSYNYTCLLYDEDGNQVYEPNEARRFFAKSKNMLLSIIDKGEDSTVRLFIAKSLPLASVEGLVSALRTLATKYGVVFNVREWARDEMEPKDFSTKSAVAESRASMNILEGMYGTSRSSYLRLENARMIVRHSARINENILGARGRNIDSIYIEDGVGQRMLFPTTQLAPARAMAHHVDNGGSWADPVGEQICRMAQDFADLIQAARHIQQHSSDLTESAMSIRECVRGKVMEMRRTFESMCRKTRYAETADRLRDMAETLHECEAPSYAEKASELASIVNTPDHKLAETVLETVARFLEDDDDEKPVKFVNPNDLNKLPPKKVDGRMKGTFAGDSSVVVNIMGRKVDAYAWNDFKKGRLELVPAPKKHWDDDELRPQQFRDPMAKLSFDLSALAARCRDHSMAALLGHVADAMMHERGEMRMKMIGLAKYALKVGGQKALDDGLAKTESIREFMQWMNAFKPTKVLLEDRPRSYADPSMNGEYDDWVDNEVDLFLDNFSPAEFIDSFFGEDFPVADLEPDQIEDIKNQIKSSSEQQLLKGLESYLERGFFNEHEIDTDMSGAAKRLWPQVVEALKKQGLMEAMDECMDEGMEAGDPEVELVDECGGEMGLGECQCIGECECGMREGAGEAGWKRVYGPVQDVTGDDAHDAIERWGATEAETVPGADEWERDGFIYWNPERTVKVVMQPTYDGRNGEHYVVSVFKQDGIEEDLELSREDVLLPKNQSVDLGKETEKATVTDPDSGKPVLADDSYIERLQSLAGMRAKF